MASGLTAGANSTREPTGPSLASPAMPRHPCGFANPHGRRIPRLRVAFAATPLGLTPNTPCHSELVEESVLSAFGRL